MQDQNDKFGFEIDFFPVGDKSKSGDAICMRWGYGLRTSKPDQFVMVVDGGFRDDGAKIKKHISEVYKTRSIDLVANTHPHADHVGGLHELIEDKSFTIRHLALHTPWTHPKVDRFFKDGRVTSKSVKQNLKEGLESVYNLVKKAKERRIPICDWFSDQGSFDAKSVCVSCLGPSKAYYESLLPNFGCTPTDGNKTLSKRLESKNVMVDAGGCPLTDEGSTSAENNTSLILSLTLPSQEVILLTGDAGAPALRRAFNRAKKLNVNLSKLWLFKVPHHGSVQNMGPRIISDLLSPSYCGQLEDRFAVISIAANPPFDHPARNLINEITAYDFKVCQTQGDLLFGGIGDFPERGYPVAKQVGPFDEVQYFV